jgi:hypothetical protein
MRPIPFPVLLGVCLVASVPAHAQPLFPRTESIESTVANSDLVVIARLVKYSDSQQVGGREVHEATIKVQETLKQDLFTLEPYTLLGVQVARPASVLADWAKRSCRLLVAIREEAPSDTTVIDLGNGSTEVFTAEMTLLRDPEAVLQVARKAVRRAPAAVKRIHTFGLQVPRETIVGTQWEKYYQTGGYLLLSVPVDQHLEKRAQGYLRSKSSQRRAEGVRAMRYFRSNENIARVRKLLNDPARAYRHKTPPDTGQEAIYVVRYEAYETLKSWGVHVTKPVPFENVPK